MAGNRRSDQEKRSVSIVDFGFSLSIVALGLPGNRKSKIQNRQSKMLPACSNDNLQLHVADLDDVVDLQRLPLAGVDPGPVEVGAVSAVEVLQPQLALLEGNHGVLPRAPDAIHRLLVFQVDVDRLLVGPA